MRRTGVAFVLSSLVAGLVVVSHASQEQGPTFRAGVQLIEVEAAVKDSQGKFVAGLTTDDFELLEDGVPQAIEGLAVAGLTSAASPTGALGDATGTARAGSSAMPARVDTRDYVIVIDSGPAPRQKEIATTFIKDVVRPGDRLAIVETPRGVPSSLPLRTSRDEMLADVNALSGLICDSASVDSFWVLRDVAARLARLEGGRKAIVFVSVGTPLLWQGTLEQLELLDATGVTRNRQSSLLKPGAMEASIKVQRAFEEAMRMATVARIPVHVVDTRGLRAVIPPRVLAERTSLPKLPDPDTPSQNPRWIPVTDPYDAMTEYSRFVAQESQSSMRLIAEETGGAAVVNTNNYSGTIKKIGGNATPTYVLTYTSPSNQFDGKFHKIEVRVKRPGVSVRARRGYYAFRPGGSISPAVKIPQEVSARARAAIEAPLPTSDLGAALRAASLSVGQPSATVMVGVEVENARNAFDSTKPVEIVWTAVADDGFGALVAIDREIVRLPSASSPGSTPALTAFHSLQLPEGTYRVMAIVSQENGPMALARGTANVVARPAEPYGFTDVVLASAAPDRRQIIVKQDFDVTLPTPPAVRHEFSKTDILRFYTEFHDVSEAYPNLLIRSTVTSIKGTVVGRHEEKLTFKPANNKGPAGDWLRPDGRRIRYTSGLGLTRLAPGAYTLMIEAVSQNPTQVLTGREVQFFVN